MYATHQDPTISDNATQSVGVLGTANYKVELKGLVRNTEYYIRSYTKIKDRYYYGEQKKIKTVGYFGPAGGIVAYDKGVTSDGWRYLEINLKSIGKYYSDVGNTYLQSKWTLSPFTYLAGTSEKMGEDINNTNFIISKIPGESAAKFCKQYSVGGFADWFLPSKEEAVTILKSLSQGGMSLNNGLTTWTSSEIDTQSAYLVYFGSLSEGPKFGAHPTYPVRRY